MNNTITTGLGALAIGVISTFTIMSSTEAEGVRVSYERDTDTTLKVVTTKTIDEEVVVSLAGLRKDLASTSEAKTAFLQKCQLDAEDFDVKTDKISELITEAENLGIQD